MEGENRHRQQPSDSNSQGMVEIKPGPNQKCPRCDSVQTRFCYFNNKKTYQPRYSCKDCKKLWTLGGIVRNSQSKDDRRMKRARDSSSSGGNVCLNYTRPQPVANQPPLKITQVDYTSPHPVTNQPPLKITRVDYSPPQPNQPPLKFTRVDINSLSLAQGYNQVLNPSMAYPQAPAVTQGFNSGLNSQSNSPEAEGQSHLVQRNGHL